MFKKSKTIISILVSISILMSSTIASYATEKSIINPRVIDSNITNINTKYLTDILCSTEEQKEAEKVIKLYIEDDLKKYDIKFKEKDIFKNIIKEDSPFLEYAKNMVKLTNNRYRSFESIRVKNVKYGIEYQPLEYNSEHYTMNATVMEEKNYVEQNEPGYICTKHSFTFEKIGESFYIIDDVTNGYIDRYLRNNSNKVKRDISELISDDIDEIKNTLKLSNKAYKEYINKVIGSSKNTIKISKCKTSDIVSDFEKSDEEDNKTDLEVSIKSTSEESYDLKNHKAPAKSVKKYNLNYNKMKAYAKKYNSDAPGNVISRNPNYIDFENYGGDCTNYVSQIIKAGGAPMDKTGSYQWYYTNGNDRSPSWTSVNALYKYLVNNDYIGPQGYLIKNDPEYVASKGDIIQIKFKGAKSFGHSLWIIKHQTATTSCTKVACHSDDRWDEPLDSFIGTRRWIKLTGYMKNA